MFECSKKALSMEYKINQHPRATAFIAELQLKRNANKISFELYMDKRTGQVNSRGWGKSLWSGSNKEARPNIMKTWLYIIEQARENLQMSFSFGIILCHWF